MVRRIPISLVLALAHPEGVEGRARLCLDPEMPVLGEKRARDDWLSCDDTVL